MSGAKSGDDLQALMPLPGFAALNPGYDERKRKRNADKRGSTTTAPSDAARVLRDALACRRSTTALVQGSYRPKAQLGPGFLRLGRNGDYGRPEPVPVQ